MNNLERAAAKGDLALVNTLLAAGADPNAPGEDQCTPLHSAVAFGHRAIVNALLAKGADPNARGADQRRPLHSAVVFGCSAIVNTLLDKGADANLRDRDGMPPLEWAANCGHLDVYRILLPLTHQPDWDRMLPYLSGLGDKEQVEVALANGANPNFYRGFFASPLANAAARGNLDVANTLLAYGADPNSSGSNRCSPLHQAVIHSSFDIVKTLLINGANPDLKQCCGRKVPEVTGRARGIIQNFIFSPQPRSLQHWARISIRARLVKRLGDDKQSLKSKIESLPLSKNMKLYVFNPLTL